MYSNYSDSSSDSEILVNLLEEKLIVDRDKRMTSEVVVRKEVTTRWLEVQVPLRREKLIVEQVAPTYKILAEIDVGEDETIDTVIDSVADNNQAQSLVKGEFTSPKTASDLLTAIALDPAHGCQRIRVEILLDDAQHQDSYQEMFDRHQD